MLIVHCFFLVVTKKIDAHVTKVENIGMHSSYRWIFFISCLRAFNVLASCVYFVFFFTFYEILFENHIFYEKVISIKIIIIRVEDFTATRT